MTDHGPPAESGTLSSQGWDGSVEDRGPQAGERRFRPGAGKGETRRDKVDVPRVTGLEPHRLHSLPTPAPTNDGERKGRHTRKIVFVLCV